MAKIKRRKRPKLTYREVEQQIFLRTGVPREMVRAAITSYCEIIQESLIGQVEIPLYKLGYFTIKQMKPKTVKQTIPNVYNTGEMIDLDGYQKPIFRVNGYFAHNMKEATLWKVGGENPMLELFNWDDGADEEDDDELDEFDDEAECEVADE